MLNMSGWGSCFILVQGGRSEKLTQVLGDRKYAFNTDAREYCVSNTSQLYPEYMLLGGSLCDREMLHVYVGV